MSELSEYLKNKVKVGAAYYPEIWKTDEIIDDDVKKMKALGVNVVRIAEFAWGTIEKKEGHFDLSFFKHVMDKLYEAKIGVVFCTPTPTPPKWLTDKYPETLRLQDNGLRKQFGARVHHCKSSPIYRKKTAKIVEFIAKEISNHPALIGWQIDNEISPDDGCVCKYCRINFQKFLQRKYGTIENLNNEWGNERWSLNYRSFKDVVPPRKDTWNHYTLNVEWARFHSFINSDFIHMQAEIVKKYSNLPIGTDMMPILDQDYHEMTKPLDVIQFNHYEQDNFFVHPLLWFNFLRPLKKDTPFWVTETQVNWNGANHVENGYKSPNFCYVNTWLPIALGGETNMYWHWREHFAGHELYHGAVLSSCGRYCINADEVKRCTDDFKKVNDKLFSTKIKSKIALHFSTTSWRTLVRNDLILKDFNYLEAMYATFNKAFRHYNLDVLDTYSDLDGYDVVISPFTVCIDENGLREKIINFVNNGGTWIVGPSSDVLKEDVAKYTHAPFGFIEEFAGVYLKKEIPCKNTVSKAKWTNGEELNLSTIYSGFELKGAESLAVYTEGLTKDLSVITCKKVGKGKVIVVGTLLDEKAILKLVDKKPILTASANVQLVDREKFIIAIEVENSEGSITLDGEYKELLTDKTYSGKVEISPYSVMCLEKIK